MELYPRIAIDGLSEAEGTGRAEMDTGRCDPVLWEINSHKGVYIIDVANVWSGDLPPGG